MLKKLSRIALAAAVVALPMLTASSAHAAYTGTISSVLTTSDKEAATEVAYRSIDGGVDALYSAVIFGLDIALEPAILSIVVALGFIYFFGGKAWAFVKGLLSGRKSRKAAMK